MLKRYLMMVCVAAGVAHIIPTAYAQSTEQPALPIKQLEKRIQTPHKWGELVIKPSLVDGAFDSHLVDCPFPFYHDGQYWMTYIGWDSVGYRTGIAKSDNLLEWEKVGMLLDRGPAGSPTEFNVALTCIVRDNDLFSSGALRKFDGRYIGTYHAYPGKGYESGPASIGICRSPDLKNWDIEEPILKPDPACGWEAGGLYKSWLMEHDGTWYMFYNAKDKTDGDWKEQTGVATSADLKNWKRFPGNPIIRNGPTGSFDAQFASDPCVFRSGDYWVMFYFGLALDGHAREGAAFSKDLVNWEKASSVLIDVGTSGTVDSTHAHKAGIIAKDGTLYHFYCAAAPAEKGVAGQVPVTENRGITFAASSPVR